MDPLTLVSKVFLREHNRFAVWAAQWMPAPLAGREASIALSNLWYDACRGLPTQQGPYAHLYRSAEPNLRRQQEARGSHLPVWAVHKLLVPTVPELQDLIRVYCTIYTAVELTSLGLAERGTVARALRRTHPDGTQWTGTVWYSSDDSMLAQTRDRLVGALLGEKPATEDQAAKVADLWIREVDRSKRWLSNHQHRAPGSTDGGEQQDHDSSHTWSA